MLGLVENSKGSTDRDNIIIALYGIIDPIANVLNVGA